MSVRDRMIILPPTEDGIPYSPHFWKVTSRSTHLDMRVRYTEVMLVSNKHPLNVDQFQLDKKNCYVANTGQTMKSTFVSMFCLTLILLFGSTCKSEDSKSQELTIQGWGGVFDPDGDCKFTIEKGSLRMSLPGSDHSLAFERGIMNAPRALRNVTGDFIAQVEVSGDYPAKAASLIPNRRPFHGAGLLVWLDEENYIRFERAKLVFEGENMSYANFEYRKEGEFIRKGDASQMPLKDGTSHLRIERRGNTLFASVSMDGVQWTAMDQIEIDMPRKVSVGVAAGHNTSSSFEPEFKALKIFREQAE